MTLAVLWSLLGCGGGAAVSAAPVAIAPPEPGAPGSIVAYWIRSESPYGRAVPPMYRHSTWTQRFVRWTSPWGGERAPCGGGPTAFRVYFESGGYNHDPWPHPRGWTGGSTRVETRCTSADPSSDDSEGPWARYGSRGSYSWVIGAEVGFLYENLYPPALWIIPAPSPFEVRGRHGFAARDYDSYVDGPPTRRPAIGVPRFDPFPLDAYRAVTATYTTAVEDQLRHPSAATFRVLERGDRIVAGDALALEVVAILGPRAHPNLVSRLTIEGRRSFLLTGELRAEQQRELLEAVCEGPQRPCPGLRADVLALPSACVAPPSAALLEAVGPGVVVIREDRPDRGEEPCAGAGEAAARVAAFGARLAMSGLNFLCSYIPSFGADPAEDYLGVLEPIPNESCPRGGDSGDDELEDGEVEPDANEGEAVADDAVGDDATSADEAREGQR